MSLNKLLELDQCFNALPRFSFREECGNHAITNQPCRFELRIDALQLRPKFSLRRPLGLSLDACAAAFGIAQMIGDELADEGRRLGRIPVSRSYLSLREPDEAVAALERVVKEREFVLARERREPQRELRQLDRAAVFVDTVEAALRHQTLGMQLFVLVVGDARPRLGPARPGLHQTRRQLPARLDQERARAHSASASIARVNWLSTA